MEMMKRLVTFQCNRRIARQLWGHISPTALHGLKELTSEHLLSIGSGDLLLLDGRWYVTHNGLLGWPAGIGARASTYGQRRLSLILL